VVLVASSRSLSEMTETWARARARKSVMKANQKQL